MKKIALLFALALLMTMLGVNALAFVEYTYYDVATDSYLPLTNGCVIELEGPVLRLRPESGEKGVLFRTVVQGPAENGWFTDGYAYIFEDSIRMYSMSGEPEEEILTVLTDKPGFYEGLSVVTLRGHEGWQLHFSVNIRKNDQMSLGEYGVMKDYYNARHPEFYPLEIGNGSETTASDGETSLRFPWDGSELVGYADYMVNIAYRIGTGKRGKVQLIDQNSGNVIFESWEERDEGGYTEMIQVTKAMMGKPLTARLICGDEIIEHHFVLTQEVDPK